MVVKAVMRPFARAKGGLEKLTKVAGADWVGCEVFFGWRSYI